MAGNSGGIVAYVARALGGAKATANGFDCRCPCHKDRTASLSLSLSDDGRLLWRCHAGCTQEAVGEFLKAAGHLPDTPRPNGKARAKREILAAYDYVDEAGVLLSQNVRCAGKIFYQRRHARPDDDPKLIRPGGWVNSAAGVRRVPYRLPEVQRGIIRGATIWICEGEKDADRLIAEGLVATTNAAGAGNWTAAHAQCLVGATAVILEDNDEAGRKRTATVGSSLEGVAASTRVIRFPELPEHGDVSDWLNSGGTVERLCALADEAPEWTNAPPPAEDSPTAEPAPAPAETPPADEGPPHVPIVARSVWDILTHDPGERVWHIPDWLPGDDVSGMFADGGEGKTQFGLQLAYCTAVGMPCVGLSPRPGASCYYSAEEPERELDYRLHSIARAIAVGEEAQRHPFEVISRARDEALLCRATRSGVIVPTKLWGEMVERMGDLRLTLLILDASADIYGGDENERPQVRSFIAMLRRAATEFNTAILLMGHPSRDGMRSGLGYSGSTAWHNSLRARWYFTTPRPPQDPHGQPDDGAEEPDKDLRQLSLEKTNRGRRGQKIMMRWQDGWFAATQGEPTDVAKLAEAKVRFLKLLIAYNGQERRVSHNKGPTYAPAKFAADPEGKPFSAKLYAEAMDLLFSENRLRNVITGPESKRRSHLEAA